MALDALTVKGAKPKEKRYRLYDTNGLYLEITPKGGKLWRLKYRYAGKEKLLSLGTFPTISLKEARTLKDDAKKHLSNDIDPSELKKEIKQNKLADSKNSFEAVTREWIVKHKNKWSASNTTIVTRRFERDLFPTLGKQAITTINAPQLLTVIQRIEKRGALYSAHKALQNCGQVFRFAIATARTENDPSSALKGALPPLKSTHHASLTDPKAVGSLLRAIKGYDGTFTTQCALKFAPLVFVRPTELRHSEWEEIDTDNAEWRIPAHKMKMKAVHIVPLS